ncbi:MAG: hypothetical protein EBV83_02170 [Verrucomicrobia bacterium]|nr:hypothetical protein [Verrucomicrobiota bacterium]
MCAKSFAVIFDPWMCFLIYPFFLFGIRFRQLDVTKLPPLLKKTSNCLALILFSQSPFLKKHFRLN